MIWERYDIGKATGMDRYGPPGVPHSKCAEEGSHCSPECTFGEELVFKSNWAYEEEATPDYETGGVVPDTDSITEKLETAIEAYEQHKASESSRGALWGHEYEDHPGDTNIDIGRE
jgi:hypothetical protein